MIRRDEKNGWLLITQHDHARLAGEIMQFWGNDIFTCPEPREEVLLAISQHDSGWQEWDARPKLDEDSGNPANFTEMDTKDQSQIWEHCFREIADEHPYAASLTALHFARFNEHNLHKHPSDENALSFKRELTQFIMEKLGIKLEGSLNGDVPEDMKINLKLLQIGDIVSLALCHGWKSIEIKDAPLDYSGGEKTLNMQSPDGLNYTVEPYPFSEPELNFSIVSRRLEQKVFQAEEQYWEALRNSEQEMIYFTIGKGS